jgi:hypothetical protein
LRAERKAGALLAKMEKAKGGQPRKNRSHAGIGSPRLADLNITPKESSRWQKLAAVPESDFEAALADPITKPTTNGIIQAAATRRTARARNGISDAAPGR